MSFLYLYQSDTLSYQAIDITSFSEAQCHSLLVLLAQIDQLPESQKYPISLAIHIDQIMYQLSMGKKEEIEQIKQKLDQISQLQHHFDQLSHHLKTASVDQWIDFWIDFFPSIRNLIATPPKLSRFLKIWDSSLLQSLHQELQWLKQINHGFMIQIINPQAMALIRGIGVLDSHQIMGIVGTRGPDRDGILFTQQLVKKAKELDLNVISGGAMGIDECAHIQALKEGLKTYIVFACGLYHASIQKFKIHETRTDQIIALSPFFSMQKADKWTFIERNRWIAYLCSSALLFVMQAGEKSGTLSTARFALGFKKQVWVCPGPILSPLYQGCHQLIQEGALILTFILEGLVKYQNHQNLNQQLHLNFDGDQQFEKPKDPQLLILWDLCSDQNPLSLEELALLSNQTIEEVAFQATMLELDGFLMTRAGKYLKSYKIPLNS